MINNALDVRYWIRALKNGWHPVNLDVATQEKIKHLFFELNKIAPVGDNDKKELWFCIRRPTFDEYKSNEDYEYEDDDEKPSIETLKSWYDEEYPENDVWFPFTSVYRHDERDGDFYGVFLENEYLLTIGDPNSQGYPLDASVFVDWLTGQVKDVIRRVTEGTYNDFVSSSLPAWCRTGTIARKDFWDLNPEMRTNFRRGLTDEEIDEFTATSTDPVPEDLLIGEMTARIFFEACGVCYDSVGYAKDRHLFYTESEEEKVRYGGKKTPKEKYYTYADGRDDNLRAVPMDDPQAFIDWNNEKGVYQFNGHHPWEIRTSGSISYSIHLIPYKDQVSDKWILLLTGSVSSSSREIVKYFLALRHAGYPVVLSDAKRICARYLETDRIGILPKSIPAFYRGDAGYIFDDRSIIDCINLDPEEHGDEVAKVAEWIPENTVTLKEESH